MTTTTISSISPKLEMTLVRSAAKAANKDQRTVVRNAATGRFVNKRKS
ncbi:MAG: hypothetical protein AAB383_03515 [Patescibacteria group bacterium]